MSTNPQDGSRPTVVLVHGAFAESASWSGVVRRLHERGCTAVVAANPIRNLSGDAEFVASILESIEGPIVLVGHSYGSAVISNAALDKENVEALVFVGTFAPEESENIGELSGRFPGSTLGDTLATPKGARGDGAQRDHAEDRGPLGGERRSWLAKGPTTRATTGGSTI